MDDFTMQVGTSDLRPGELIDVLLRANKRSGNPFTRINLVPGLRKRIGTQMTIELTEWCTIWGNRLHDDGVSITVDFAAPEHLSAVFGIDRRPCRCGRVGTTVVAMRAFGPGRHELSGRGEVSRIFVFR